MTLKWVGFDRLHGDVYPRVYHMCVGRHERANIYPSQHRTTQKPAESEMSVPSCCAPNRIDHLLLASAYVKDQSLTSKGIWDPNEVTTESSQLDDPRPTPKLENNMQIKSTL